MQRRQGYEKKIAHIPEPTPEQAVQIRKMAQFRRKESQSGSYLLQYGFVRRQLMKRILVAAALVPMLALGACGDTVSDRALSGGGIGAGTGALIGLAVHRPLEGALIGGVLGAGAGAVTTSDQVNLGRPLWR
jgi:osmotically inducible lipoprotein OsmB